MRVAVLLLVVIACSTPPPETPISRPATAAALADPVALVEMFRDKVEDGGLWFDDATCAASFPAPREIPKAELAQFAACVAGLHLQPSKRGDTLDDVIVMSYGAGFELEVRMVVDSHGLRILWIGFASRAPGDPFLPTITSDALDSLRTSGDRNGPLDPGFAGTLVLDRGSVSAWIKVCIDIDGGVTSATSFETTSPPASKAFATAASLWQFKPFVVNKKPMPACALVRMAYPTTATLGEEVLPLPPPLSHVVFAPGSHLVEGHRISGSPFILPTDITRDQIASRGTHVTVTGRFRICVDATGHVESVLPIQSTGFPAYDHKILGEMAAWVYSPYVIDGKPTAVCTAVVFNYSTQR